MVDFTKVDFSKFDVTKVFDVDAVIKQMEENTKTALSFITDKKAREVTETITSASLDFARAQAVAAKAYSEAVKKATAV